MDDLFVCLSCKRGWPADRYNRECSAPDLCFACRSKSVKTAFAGGKEYFHDGTEAERTRKTISEAKAAGFDPVPMETGKAWNGVAPSTIKKLETVMTKKASSE